MLVSTLTALILPLAVLAAPAAEAVPASREAIREAEAVGLAKRDRWCAIVNVSTTVNCRSTPSTSGKVVATFTNGIYVWFSCYKTGTCVNGNCTWDYAPGLDCYVSGYYTDDTCTKAALGAC